MRSITLAVALAVSVPSFAADKPVAVATAIDMKNVEKHLRDHQKYPASKAELIAGCKELVDFSAGDKKWFARVLPDGTYASADAVLSAISGKK